MENKTIKFVLKILTIFPSIFFLTYVLNGFDLKFWVFEIIISFMTSFGIVFWQLFDYEKYNEISYEDFLESKHSLSLENSEENWDQFNEMIKNPLLELEIIERTDEMLKVLIARKFIDSILTVRKTKDAIIVNIEKKFFSFLPDRAENYRTIQKLAKRSQQSKRISTSEA
ncbi:hypothetical protein DFQ03_1532 [Maribacter caenipelagi]|mgnify:CR=1 FL=1|uniref:Uncharacterized protein n=1 Tax=Maribacter caenipelagi TaxID=1447781 RepID=A0A4R7D9I9_9FLAO|nr:hypothetical protein [Maribacter caenipelagi]TDS17042.1 hypothetical protein DFQ03_1532 [Maribacter caenipelagi]|tara:strand:+ start:487 stop:996 length:510 start_codon:yes stop_codon:yes gene_type:complete